MMEKKNLTNFQNLQATRCVCLEIRYKIFKTEKQETNIKYIKHFPYLSCILDRLLYMQYLLFVLLKMITLISKTK